MTDVKCDDCGVDAHDLRADDSGTYCEACYRKTFVESALSAGIPMSVIEGRSKLSDHFSKEYIAHKIGRK